VKSKHYEARHYVIFFNILLPYPSYVHVPPQHPHIKRLLILMWETNF